MGQGRVSGALALALAQPRARGLAAGPGGALSDF